MPDCFAFTASIGETLFEHSPDASLIVGSDGIILRANAKATLLTGYGLATLLGSPVEILVPELIRDLHPTFRAVFFEDPRPRTMGLGLDLKLRQEDGTEVPVDIDLFPLVTDDNRKVVRVTIQPRRDHRGGVRYARLDAGTAPE